MGGDRGRGCGGSKPPYHQGRPPHAAGRPPRQPCHYFASRQGMPQRRDCAFLHEQPNSSGADNQTSLSSFASAAACSLPSPSSPSSSCSTPAAQPLLPFSVLITRPDFRNQHDMRRLVLSALQERDVEEVLLGWTNKQHPERLGLLCTLLQEAYVINAGWHATSVSFQRVLVPLITLLASDRLANTAHASCWKLLLSVVGGQVEHFMPRAVTCIERLTAGGQLEEEKRIEATAGRDVTYVVTRWEEVVLPFLDLLYLLSSQMTDFAAEHAEDVHVWCERFDTVVQRCSATSPRLHEEGHHSHHSRPHHPRQHAGRGAEDEGAGCEEGRGEAARRVEYGGASSRLLSRCRWHE